MFRKTKTTLRPSPTALLNPKADPIFKILFTDHSKEARIALEEFLSALLYTKVSDVRLLPNVLSGETKQDRQTQFDLTCKLANNEYANIEMQSQNDFKSYDRRAEYNVAHLLNHFVRRGTKWPDVPTAFQISVMNFVYNKKSQEDITWYTMRSEKGDSLSNSMNVIFMELPKFKKYRDCNPSDLTTIQKWGTFFVYADDIASRDFIDELAKEDFGIMNVLTVLSRLSRSERNWFRERNYWFNISNLRTMEYEATERGLEKGLAEGKARGLEEGRAEGIAEGRAEGRIQNSVEVIRKYNLDPKQYAEDFGIPLEELMTALEK